VKEVGISDSPVNKRKVASMSLSGFSNTLRVWRGGGQGQGFVLISSLVLGVAIALLGKPSKRNGRLDSLAVQRVAQSSTRDQEREKPLKPLIADAHRRR
jgi:hypothetical protein